MNRIILTIGPEKQRVAVDMDGVLEVVEYKSHTELRYKQKDNYLRVNETFDEVLIKASVKELMS